ncbi:amidophosphoribosyltransferase [Tuwongella immobilis]|uniref:Amidophosphoribosyltransferase n=1 Tax=Tuwongella immobilis TaxID=692036 RepID=A0A6C2YPQ0_9BACT|nr:amidophosphoribosyltransferase [Tuwongella immobilis]VIP03436.1 amidophosphoribosyltransferase : Amidophosphoribosyltransferase OS=Pirellula staleyi (strain ATCC 27377 / DSM 6068 / ICPB 4128) GN=Psta_2159 PE=3 SV=1: GATase_6: Pribosyltran [Tuwongella immobilis]VTS04244.1 amidophosphoribosyltransferase : Amidophosphoribosyltransferase OS=Pirellula staleyi (strain ATCC 27377 / DSM 6068 / ICPB 4128) GN=Psta_2159 PE=3 SV=1: GATase_6: Pribosyltran [Tuwongella immobilis]
MAELFHECGIAAIYHLMGNAVSPLTPQGPGQVTRLMPRMLLDLQNRGQLAAGMSSFNPDRDEILDTYKQVGTVIEAFRLNHPGKAEAIMKEYSGNAAIGHVRYATCGPNTRQYAQPFERRHGCKWKWFSFGFNGHLANLDELRKAILSLNGYHLTKKNDTEVMMHFIAHALRGDHPPDLVQVFTELAQKFDGAYNLVFLNGMGDMVVLRDPKGLHPLCVAQEGPLFAAASESVALQNLGFREVRSMEPGELILIQDGKITSHRFAPKQQSAHCFFEWIYFANVASTLDERSVYLSRSALGLELAQQERDLGKVPIDADTIVVPVPDTGKAAADAMAHALGLPSVEGLMRNRYVGRTFIEGTNRLDRVRLKYTPLREVLQGKRVLLIEDTIVRSTTLKSLLHHIRERGGAKEIHVRVACPPIIAPCFYGIDMSTVSELFAPQFMKTNRLTVAEQEAMARELKADSLFYLPVEAVARCIDLPQERLCRACITGEYPTPVGQQLYQVELARTKAAAAAAAAAASEPKPPVVCGAGS